MEFNLIEAFYNKVKEKNVSWQAKGIVFDNGVIYTINHDTKLLGRIFEIITQPLLEEIATEHGYTLSTPEQQNYYPDFILTPIGSDKDKIAVDVKTTYRSYTKKGLVKPYMFTLGSYCSFLRNGTKNCQGHYDDYAKHYVIGFVYDRNEDAKNFLAFDPEDIDDAPSPYSNVEFFVQEKYRIAGQGTGSGNTENIGTIRSREITSFIEGEGIFANLGNEVFEYYWQHYPRYKDPVKPYTDFEGFKTWVLGSEGIPSQIVYAIENLPQQPDTQK